MKLLYLFIKNKAKQYTSRSMLLLFLLILPFSLFSQVTFTKAPIDKQLVARDNNDEGTVIFEGEVDNTGIHPDSIYFEIEVEVRRKNYSGFDQILDPIIVPLNYDNNIAPFSISIGIDAELYYFNFVVFGKNGSGDKYSELHVDEVVAGDVYIIQGQSNAVAKKQEGSASSYENNFIRVYGSGNKHSNKLITEPTHREWNVADGDLDTSYPGAIGQWGLVLANKIITDYSIPIAIFNGATGAKPINYFQKNYDNSSDGEDSLNNYERMLYRLNITELKDEVKAIIWSQGESEPSLNSSLSIQGYINDFITLKNSWSVDYSSIQKIYIFQTKSSCGPSGDAKIIEVKEAQRRIAEGDNNIDLMQTTGLDYATGNVCHFRFSNGYEEFGKRIYKLIDRHFYGGTYNTDINTPMLTDAYLTSNTTLTVETDAISLVNNSIPVSKFILENAGGVSINSITVSDNKIFFLLSGDPGTNATISYLGLNNGENSSNLITNLLPTNDGLEIVCFGEYPLDATKFTIWDGNNWSNGVPNSSKYSIVDGTYNASDGSIHTLDLTINSGENLNFDGGTTNSIAVYGDLTINGDFMVGDTESLIVKNTDANVTIDGSSGTFTKKEKTTTLKSSYDVTYFSSPVENPSISSTFPGVDPNRIFYMDPTNENPNYTSITYYKYRHWFIAQGSDVMIPGKGFSVDGKTIGAYPNEIMEVSFTGKPNYKDITVTLHTGSSVADDADLTNLIGNPYPSAIDVDLLIQENGGNFLGTLYFWSHNSNYISGEYNYADYLTYNLTGPNSSQINIPYYIASGQGFMILTNQNNSNFNFKNSMQIENENDQFFKSDNDKIKNKVNDRIWLQLTKGLTEKKEILIGFTDKASEGVDYGYDGKLINEDASTTFYTMINNDKYAIQGLNTFSEEKIINVGFSTQEAGEFSISKSKTERVLQEQEILLIDNQLNIIHDLNQSDYKFVQTVSGDFPNRFTLEFASAALDVKDFENENNFIIINSNGGYRIHSSSIIKELKIYDLLGRQLFQNTPNHQDFEIIIPSIKKGSILIFKATFENGAVLSKKTIKARSN